MVESEDQKRRASPKVTVTLRRENLEYLEALMRGNPRRLSDRSKAVYWVIEQVRRCGR